MKSLSVFIISWTGKHKNAIKIAKDLINITTNITIVYSDENPRLVLDVSCNLIKRPNNLFWEDKFKSCIDACGDGPVLVIHADCICKDWPLLIKRYHAANLKLQNIGVWAPKIDNTYCHLEVSRLFKKQESNLHMCTLTDGIVFALSPSIVRRMRKVKYGNNTYGWGIATLFCAAAFVINEFVIIDDSVEIRHAKDTGYDTKVALDGMNGFFKQFQSKERILAKLLISHLQLNYLKSNTKH